MNSPITQSKAWQHLQGDLGEISFWAQQEDFYYLAILKKTPVGNYLYLPYGPVANTEKGFKSALKALESLARKHQAIFIRVEPQAPEMAHFLPSTAKKVKDLNPKDTWRLDLTSSREALISNFARGLRSRCRNYTAKGLVVEHTKDPAAIAHLVALQAKLFQKKHLTPFGEAYLKAELSQPFSTLYLVKYHVSTNNATPADNSQAPAEGITPVDVQAAPADGQVLAASLFFDYDGMRYYMQSAADPAYKKLHATVALLYEAIFDAKEQGITTFDFWGIAPDGAPATHPWAGFTEFKKSFGGYPVHYVGTYDIPLNSAKYRLYTLTRKIAHRVHHS